MNVVHVVRQFSPSVGGLEEAVMKLCKALQKRGVVASVVTLNRICNSTGERLPDQAIIDGVDVCRIPFRGSWRYPIAPGVLGHLGQADVVHVHGIDFFFDFLAMTRPIHRKALVASTHGGFFHTTFARRLKQVYFSTVTRASALAYKTIAASSDSDFDLFAPITGSRLASIPNGVDVLKWRGLANHTTTRRLLYIGRFSSNKNLPALFQVLRRLRDLHPDWSLTIAGRPWDVTTAELRHQAEQQGVSAAVDFLDSPSDAGIAEAIGFATYVVSASRHEGFGLSIVEGLSAGLIPVVNAIAPFVALVSEAGCGLATDFTAPQETAEAVETLHRTVRAQPQRFRAAAMASARRYSWDAAADLFVRHYAEALGTVTAAPLPSPVSHI